MFNTLTSVDDDLKNFRSASSPDDAITDAEIAILFDIIRNYNNQKMFFKLDPSRELLFWRYAEQHGLGGLLGFLSYRVNLQSDFIVHSARRRFHSNTIHFERSMKFCRKIHEISEQNNISVFIMKGPAISSGVYADNGIRSFADIDLFAESSSAAIKIAESLDADFIDLKRDSFLWRMRQSAKIHLESGGIEIEICFPLDNPSDPVYSMLKIYGKGLFRKRITFDEMMNPDPYIHAVFLIIHMSINHYFSKLVWFLDLYLIVKKNNLDVHIILNMLDQFGMSNAGLAVLFFCNKHIDAGFAKNLPEKKGWRNRLMQVFISEDFVANSRLAMKQAGVINRIKGFLIHAGTFYYFFDYNSVFRFYNSASYWSTVRFLNAFSIKSGLMIRIVEPICSLIMTPYSRIAGLILVAKHGKK